MSEYQKTFYVQMYDHQEHSITVLFRGLARNEARNRTMALLKLFKTTTCTQLKFSFSFGREWE